MTRDAQQTIHDYSIHPGATWIKTKYNDVSSTEQGRRCAILSGGSSSYMGVHGFNLKRGGVELAGMGLLRQMENDMRAAKERAAMLELENERLRAAIEKAPKVSNETIAAWKREIDTLKAKIKSLEDAVGIDEAMASGGRGGAGKFRANPKTFMDSEWANDLLCSGLLQRENQRSANELKANDALNEARLKVVLREVADAEEQVNVLVGKGKPKVSALWEKADEFKERFGELLPHEENWSLEGWLEVVLQSELPKLFAKVPFEDLLSDAPPSVRDSPAGRRAFLYALGSDAEYRSEMMASLRRGGVATLLSEICKILWDATERFAKHANLIAESRATLEAERAAAEEAEYEQLKKENVSAVAHLEDHEDEEDSGYSSSGSAEEPEEVPDAAKLRRSSTSAAISEGLPPPTAAVPMATLMKMHKWITTAKEDAKLKKRTKQIGARTYTPNKTAAVAVLSGPPPVEPLHDPYLIFKSLAELAGNPSGNDPISSMEMEHLRRADSRIEFVTVCGGFTVSTTSELEWLIVRDPDRALGVIGEDDWLMSERTPISLGFREVFKPDAERFNEKLEEINSRLAQVGDQVPFDTALFHACRMFSGPASFKYFHILRRAHSNNPTVSQEDLCRGNMYPTTLHHVCKGVHKLSQLTRAVPVYCAPAWSPLPASFFDPANRNFTNADGSRGALQLGGDLEMNPDKGAAKAKATALGSAIVYEVQQTSTQRGALLQWLAQTTMGDESVLFSPIAAFDVVNTRIEGAHTVVELHPMTRPIIGGQMNRRGSLVRMGSESGFTPPVTPPNLRNMGNSGRLPI